jgi:cytochrome c551/c552
MKGSSNTRNHLSSFVLNNPLSDKTDIYIYQQEKDPGIGPVKSVKLGPIDTKMAASGKSLFTAKCLVCHEMDTKKVGPPLRNITKERKPEYIMNLLVNATQMQKEDAFVKELFKKYNMVPMPDPLFNQTQARSVLEYLRSMAK